MFSLCRPEGGGTLPPAALVATVGALEAEAVGARFLRRAPYSWQVTCSPCPVSAPDSADHSRTLARGGPDEPPVFGTSGPVGQVSAWAFVSSDLACLGAGVSCY